MDELGVLGIIHLAIVVYAFMQIFGSSASGGRKVLWIVIVALFPVVGVIAWYFIGPRASRR